MTQDFELANYVLKLEQALIEYVTTYGCSETAFEAIKASGSITLASGLQKNGFQHVNNLCRLDDVHR